MSGTGASVYALFDSDSAADAVAREVPAEWRHFRARRVNRSPLAVRLAAQD
jgi:4-diphosphocytidyl-2C-methyl-D-erythritol kinase